MPFSSDVSVSEDIIFICFFAIAFFLYGWIDSLRYPNAENKRMDEIFNSFYKIPLSRQYETDVLWFKAESILIFMLVRRSFLAAFFLYVLNSVSLYVSGVEICKLHYCVIFTASFSMFWGAKMIFHGYFVHARELSIGMRLFKERIESKESIVIVFFFWFCCFFYYLFYP